MKKDKLALLESMADKLIETTTADIGQFPEMIKPLLYKIYTNSLVSEIADMQQLMSSSGKVYTLFSNYGGSETDDLNSLNSSVIVVSDGSTLVLNDTITTATGSGVIKYIEGNNLLVSISSGHFAVSQIINAGTINIVDVISNRNYAKKMFANYNGPYSTTTGESTVARALDHEVRESTIDVKTRKLKSKITLEVMQDIKSRFGEDISTTIITNEFSNEMIQSIDMEVINYLKTVATPITDVVLSNSYAVTGGSLGDVAADLYVNIYKLTVDIMRDTKRRKNFFVMADAATMGILMASPLYVKPEKNVNTYFMGYIGGNYPLYLDPYSTDHYVVVGYKREDEEMGDAGLIFAPYMNTIWSTSEPETGNGIFFNTSRYGYTLHPQDTSTGLSDSIFFKMFNVNLDGLSNYTNISNL
jgi:hypothetical protein